ncbi:hypothetical protein HYH03_012993 [Edaphochlamys debaryana]|uniref:rRNA biogenesis protein RRP36 n=1 Tax=Edaphochlamys debaryana TaxID=47281 RepID=A0A835XRM0_9CHLO|nr:hypothetical protein HYH03_012993 [Edaphochlamys debaryana]|eukprot:KAG2488489.1 hypothetical protein HYH03_012993 [Edaphochlamys debaryana]
MDADQLRALKRMRANLEDDEDDSEEEPSDEDDEGPDIGGAPFRRPAPGLGRRGADEDDDEEEEDEEEDDEEEEDQEEEDEDEEGEGAGSGSDEEAAALGSGSDDDVRTLEEQVADVPFEVLEAIKRDGRGLVGQAARAAAARAAAATFKRDNKDRPQEMSSKRPVGRFREVIQVPHKETRDPRFDSTSGPPPTDAFRRNYAFLYNETLPAEKEELRAKLKKEKNPKFKARIQAQLQRVDGALREEGLRRRTAKLETEWKTKEKQAVAGGKNPFFLKDADKKRLQLLAKYQELKERGKLDKFMEKRRKKNASKDHRYLPSGRRQQGDE